MLVIVKAVLVLVLELIIEYLFGTMLVKLLLKRNIHPLVNVLIGFMGYQALFQVLSLAVTFTTGILHHLSFIWFVVSVGITISALLVCKKVAAEHIQQAISVFRKHKAVCSAVLAVMIIFCYYVSINGESFINNVPSGHSFPLFETLTLNEFSPKCSDIVMYIEVVLDHLQKQILNSQIELIS